MLGENKGVWERVKVCYGDTFKNQTAEGFWIRVLRYEEDIVQ